MDKQEKIGNILNRLRHLKQYKNKSEEELLELARKRYQEELVDLSGVAITPEEKKQAKKLLGKYLSEGEITSFADRSDLAKLIDLEIIHLRFQAQLNASYDKDDEKPMAVSLDLVESMHDNIKEMSVLKQKLGLVRDEKERQDPLAELNTLKARFIQYVLDHRELFTMPCSYCGKMNLIAKRVLPDEVVRKMPFLKYTAKGIIVYNQKLLDLVTEGKITVKDASEVLIVPSDYITWIMKKHYKKEENAGEADRRGN